MLAICTGSLPLWHLLAMSVCGPHGLKPAVIWVCSRLLTVAISILLSFGIHVIVHCVVLTTYWPSVPVAKAFGLADHGVYT